jgi:hypothetical protein
MYWSNFSIDTYRTMLAEAGFTIVREQLLGHGYGDGDHVAETHPLILAQAGTA